jgi:hypothetical protein
MDLLELPPSRLAPGRLAHVSSESSFCLIFVLTNNYTSRPTHSSLGNERDRGDLVAFLDEEKYCDGARGDGILFVRGRGGEPGRDWLYDGVSFLGARRAGGESREGRTFAGTVVRFGLSVGVEGVNLLA